MIGYKQLVIKQVIFEEFQVEKELIEVPNPTDRENTRKISMFHATEKHVL